MEGLPLSRFAAAAAAPGDAARAMEGLPLSALPSNSDGGLNSFENSRLNSLIRTLSEERAAPPPAAPPAPPAMPSRGTPSSP
mmetsp:Transcript_8635/g.25987  ORF Transcript_8635/g.25987 Transcript_8635/m.25987 type:complete len:82 (+) Transcript_8635:3-248(+)